MFGKEYKVGQSFSKDHFKFKSIFDIEDGTRYYDCVHWFGLDFLPVKQFVTLELQHGRWNVISTS